MSTFPSKLIFPSWCLDDITAEDEFQTTIQASRGAESRNSDVSESRFKIDLSGGLVDDPNRRQARAFLRGVRGRYKTFLYRRYRDAEWELSGPDGRGELLGIGDGARTQFQARIYDEIQTQPVSYTVRWLDHDIPSPGKNGQGAPVGLENGQVRLARVFVGTQEIQLGTGFSVNRETGLVTLVSAPQNGAEVRLKCGFFVLVRLNREGIPFKPRGGGWWEIPSGVALIEPRGGK